MAAPGRPAVPNTESQTAEGGHPTNASEPLTVGHVSNVHVTEHVENVLHVPRRRPLLIVGALLAIVLLSVFLPPFLKRDASLTETTNQHDTPNSKSEISNLKSQISNSKSQIPADPERAAAEWVLSQKGSVVSVEFITAQDGQRRPAKMIAELPKEPFRLISVYLVNVADLDAAAIQQHLDALNSLEVISLEQSRNVTDDAIPVLSKLPAFVILKLQNTGITAKGVLTLLHSEATTTRLKILGVDEKQFTSDVAAQLAKLPTINGLGLINASDEQVRHLLMAKQLVTLSLDYHHASRIPLRHSTFVRIAEELPLLKTIYLDHTCGIAPANASLSLSQQDPDENMDADVAVLSRLPVLGFLAVNNVKLTDVGLAHLATASELNHLAVDRTAVTPLGLADFLESHPACQVVWDGADHRAVAEWVLSVGGKVQVAGRGAEWLAESSLHAPPEESRTTNDADRANDVAQPTTSTARSADFTRSVKATWSGPVLLTGVDLSGLATLKDADLARLADCTTLRDLQLHNASLTGACLTHLQALAKAGSPSQPQHDAPASGRTLPKRNHSLARRAGMETGPRLRTLSLAGLPIEDQDLAHLGELKQLQYLYLNKTKITDAGMPSLSGLTELGILTLKDTAITTAGLESLKRLPKLQALDLQNTSADDRTAELLCEFPNLVSVVLNNTRITEAGVKRLAQRSLPWWRLNLANLPTVTDEILTDLHGHRELNTLDLSQTNVTPGAFEAFVREHPRLGMTLATDDSESPDLRVARRVLAAGGEIAVAIATTQPSAPLIARVAFDASRVVRRIEDLPKDPFRITIIDLRPAGAKVTDETLAEVGRLEMLGHFHTTDAAISNAIIAEIATAPMLAVLEFVGTPLSAAAVRQIATKTELTELHLHNTALDGPTAASLIALIKLKVLSIGLNSLTDDDVAFVEKLADLEALGIAQSQITNHGWASIAKLPKLKHLRAYNMPVTDEALRHAGQIESLELLSVGGAASEVGDAGLQHLRSLRHLRELHLNHCRRLTDAGLESLADLPALETLHLNATPITDAGLKHLAKIKTLKSLNLTECQLSEAALDDLQDTLPWCRIVPPK